jgi:preprotein translocase subunit SecD
MEFGGEIISFAETIASDPDFEAVEPVVRPGRLLLRFVMKPESADRIRSVTANSVGRGLALVVDSEVRSVSVIRDSIGAMGVATIEVPTEEAEELAEAVRDSFPPGSPRAPRPVPIP